MSTPLSSRLLRVASLCFVLFPGLGCGNSAPSSRVGGPSGSPPAPAEPTPVARADVSAEKPDFTTTADEFFDDHAKGADAAAAKYKGKVVQITGVVADFVPKQGLPIVLLKTKKGGDTGLQCVTTDKEPWATVAVGEPVAVKGRWQPFVTSGLVDCVFVDLPPNPAPRLTAAALAKESRADKEKATEKYKQKWVIVDGEFVTASANGSLVSLELKGLDKLPVRCRITPADVDAKRFLTKFSPGQHVKLAGEVNFFDDDAVLLNSCLVISG